LQSTINIFDQSCLSVLEEASNLKINVIAKEVFSNGRLTSANKNLHKDEIDSLMEIAKKLDMSLEELSFLWVYQIPFIKIVLTGASTISQIKENINSLEKKYSQIPNLDEFALPVNDYWSTRSLLNWN
jgi:aryl-alcohol dehydrogenase-like predicted oxidoreductase